MIQRVFLFAVLVVILAVLCTLFAGTASNTPYSYDEADYMYAGDQGFAANYLDRNALPLTTFIKKGLELAHDKTLARSTSDYVRSSGDLSFYRHYHGPVYAFWIALWHGVGLQGSAGYRATGLIVHALGAMAIFWLFLAAFPDLPAVAALIAALMFAMNRTALLTATMISQHLAYLFLACLGLFAAAMYLRTREMRYWYATAALLAICFDTVEISLVLIAAVVLSVIVLDWSAGWRKILLLFGKGAAIFVGVMAIVWPPGVFELNALKGYASLAYLAIARKYFTPISPRQLWLQKLETYPLEFVLPLALAIVAVAYWRRLTNRRAVTPFLMYSCLLFGASLVVTIPKDYYLSSLMLSLAIVAGVVFGEFSKEASATLRALSVAVIFLSLAALDAGYYRDTVRQLSAAPTLEAEALQYLDTHPPAAMRLVAPLLIVPTLHYYRPSSQIVSYDPDASLDRLTETSPSILDADVFCPESICRQIETRWPSASVVTKERLPLIGGESQPWYAMTVVKR